MCALRVWTKALTPRRCLIHSHNLETSYPAQWFAPLCVHAFHQNLGSSHKSVYIMTGQSRGYGFVHFENEASALASIENVKGMLLNESQAYAGEIVLLLLSLFCFCFSSDPGLRKSGNVFIRSLDKSVDNQTPLDTVSHLVNN